MWSIQSSVQHCDLIRIQWSFDVGSWIHWKVEVRKQKQLLKMHSVIHCHLQKKQNILFTKDHRFSFCQIRGTTSMNQDMCAVTTQVKHTSIYHAWVSICGCNFCCMWIQTSLIWWKVGVHDFCECVYVAVYRDSFRPRQSKNWTFLKKLHTKSSTKERRGNAHNLPWYHHLVFLGFLLQVLT